MFQKVLHWAASITLDWDFWQIISSAVIFIYWYRSSKRSRKSERGTAVTVPMKASNDTNDGGSSDQSNKQEKEELRELIPSPAGQIFDRATRMLVLPAIAFATFYVFREGHPIAASTIVVIFYVTLQDILQNKNAGDRNRDAAR